MLFNLKTFICGCNLFGGQSTKKKKSIFCKKTNINRFIFFL